MLEIIVNSEKLDIPVNTSVTINMNNPMFTETGSYSYPFKLPKTTKNKKILGFDTDIDAIPGLFRKTCEVCVNNLLLFEGEMVINRVDKNEIQVNIELLSGIFFNKIQSKLLKKLNLGGLREMYSIRSTSGICAANAIYKKYPDVDWAWFSVWNNTLETLQPQKVKYQNMYDSAVYYPDGRLNYIDIGYFTPFVFVNCVLKYLFEEHNYFLYRNFFYEHQELRQLCLYSNRIVTQGEHRLNMFMPEMTIGEFLSSLCTLFNASVFIGNNNHVYIYNNWDVVNSNRVIDFNKNVNPGYSYVYEKPIDDLTLTWNIKDKNTYAQRNTNTEVTVEKIHSNSVWAMDDLPDSPDQTYPAGSIVRLYHTDSYYILTNETGSWKWPFFSSSKINRIVKNSSLNYSINASTIQMIYHFADLNTGSEQGKYWVTPRIDCITNRYGSSFTAQMEETPLKLMIWRGMDTDNRGYEFPSGTTKTYRYLGRKWENATVNLNLVGEDSIYDNFWKKYIEWKREAYQKFEFQKKMSIVELINFEFFNKYQILGHNIVVSKLSFTIKNKPEFIVKIEGYKA